MGETSKKRGLLEDFRLQCEVGLTVAFERLRWALRKVLWLPAPSARQRQAISLLDEPDDAAAVGGSHLERQEELPSGSFPAGRARCSCCGG